MIPGRLCVGLTLALCACARPAIREARRPPAVAACARPPGSLLARLQTITAAPTVWASFRLPPAQDPAAFVATLGARVAQLGGDLLDDARADGLVRAHLRLPHASAPAVAGLLAPGTFGLHPVEDAAVHAMAETIRARLPLAPDVTLERWEGGPAELVSDDHDALVRFASDLPIPPGTGWVFMGSPGRAEPPSSHRALLVGAARFTAADLERCSVLADAQAGPTPELVLVFREAILPDFKAWTAAHVGRRVAFVFDDAVYTAPTVQEAIPGPSLRFSGGGGGDVATLVALLRGGPLDAGAELVDLVFDLTARPATLSGHHEVGDVAPE